MSEATTMHEHTPQHSPGVRPYEEMVIENLRKDPAFAADYFETCAREGTTEEMLLALRRIVKAYGGVAKLAAATGLNENTLHRTLSAKGNPRFNTLLTILDALGMELHITPRQTA
jgi:probable addiction module antidote protein